MYNISLSSKSERFLKKAEKGIRLRIWDKIDELKINPFPSDVVRVAGIKEKAFRVRVGSYRIQYYVFQDRNDIVIFDIDKRKRAYN